MPLIGEAGEGPARSAFVAVVGRPNVGKSSLINALVGAKVTITSPRPNTTRLRARGVLHRQDAQIVFVDTPGLHRPRTPLGERLNEATHGSLSDVDVAVVVVDATAEIGPGDRRALSQAMDAGKRQGGPQVLVAVNKIDAARRAQIVHRLASVADAVEAVGHRGAPHHAGDRTGEEGAPHHAGDRTGEEGQLNAEDLDQSIEYFPVSARSGEGLGALADALAARALDGPALYPAEMVTDLPEQLRVAEMVREQLLHRVHDELPHSIACQVTEWEWPYVRCEIIVERKSQKPMVIGKGGEVLKEVGTAVRQAMPSGAHLDLFVRVEPHWQRRNDALNRLGL